MDYKIAWNTRYGHSEILEPSAAGAVLRVHKLQEMGAASITIFLGDAQIAVEELPMLVRKELSKGDQGH